MRWLSLHEAAEALDWDAEGLRRLLCATSGVALPGAILEAEGWTVPESALRRITGAGLFLFSFKTLSQLLDCSYDSLRRLEIAGKLQTVEIPGVGKRVPWREYQRLTGRAARK